MNNTETEELYPFMVPEDEDGFVWSVVYKTKKEVIATLDANNMNNDDISETIIERNQQYVSEFGLDVKTYSESLNL